LPFYLGLIQDVLQQYWLKVLMIPPLSCCRLLILCFAGFTVCGGALWTESPACLLKL